MTKRRTTTNLKTKSNRNCQKIELNGSLTTKALKKKHSFRPVGGAEMGSRLREDMWQGSDFWTRWSHIFMRINQEEQLWGKTDCTTQGSSGRKESLKTCKNLWGLWWREKLPASQKFVGEPRRVLEHTQMYSPRNQHQKGPICLWVGGEVTESWPRAKQVPLFPLGTPPHIEPQCNNSGCPTLVKPKAPPLTT